MELTKIYFFILTVVTNFSFETFAQDTLSGYASSTTNSPDNDDDRTLAPGSTAPPLDPTTTHLPYAPSTARAHFKDTQFGNLDNLTHFDKSLLRTTESTWEPVSPSLRFGMLTPNRRRRLRPKCCRRVRENEKSQERKLNCNSGSIFLRDARGRRRRKCRRRNRCKRRCKQHYSNTAWGIVETVMKGMDFFLPKLEFKFHTGTLVFGTKFFSGLVPFLQAKIQMMHFVYSMFEPLLDGVLDALDFSRIGFRSMSLEDDDDEEDDRKKTGAVASDASSSSVIIDHKNDAEQDEDYDENEIAPDLLLSRTDVQDLPDEDDDDEGYVSPKDEPIDEDYGIDEDWDGEDDDDDEEEQNDDDDEDEDNQSSIAETKRIPLLTIPQRPIIKRPIRPKPTRKSGVLGLITPPNDVDVVHGDQQTIEDFMNRIKDEDVNFTVYHGTLKQNQKLENKIPSRLPLNDTPQVVNVDHLVLNINNKPAELYEDDVEYQDEDPIDELDDDKLLVEKPSAPVRRVKSKPPIFSSFTAFFGGLSDAFDSYFSGTY